MKQVTKILLVFIGLAGIIGLILAGCQEPGDDTSTPAVKAPKNVILLIPDGCGYNQIAAANYYLGVPGQVYENFPVKYGMSTYEFDGSYDPTQAWSDFNYVIDNPTDSASAATTMSTGIKTDGGNIGYNADDTLPLKHAFEYAEEKGYSTGVVTSVQWTHATPAAFVAHNVSRNNYAEIGVEMIDESKVDVIMGCGHPTYDNDGILKTTGFEYKYVGGQTTWDALVAGTAGNADANGDGVVDAKDKWTLIQTKAEFVDLACNTNPAVDRVCGVAQVYSTLQQSRTEVDTVHVYGDTFNATVPSLETMTRGALNVLNKNPRGFFLMVEGGAIDWAGHANQSNRVIEEQIEFNKAVDAVIAWVNAYSNWNETLVIVAGDHETGYLWGPGSNPTWEPLVDNGLDNLPGMAWFSGDHTNSLIPFFAKGKGADLFHAKVAGNDSVRGAYIDNAAIGEILVGFCK